MRQSTRWTTFSRCRLNRRTLLLLSLPAALLLLFCWALPAGVEWYLRERLLPRIGQRYGVTIECHRIRFGLFTTRLKQLEVRARQLPPVLRAREVTIDHGLSLWLRLVSKQPKTAPRVLVSEPTLHVIRFQDGRNNLGKLLSHRDLPRSMPRQPPGAPSSLTYGHIVIQSGKVILQDYQQDFFVTASVHGHLPEQPKAAIDMHFDNLDLELRRISRKATVAKLTLTGSLSNLMARHPSIHFSGGSLQVLPHLLLSGISGSLVSKGASSNASSHSHDSSSPLLLKIAGSYGGATTQLWSAEGWVDPFARRGTVSISAARFSLDRLKSILNRTPILSPEHTMVDGKLTFRLNGDRLNFSGGLDVTRLSLFHPRLARTPVVDMDTSAFVSGDLHWSAERLTLASLRFKFRGVELDLSGSFERLSGKPRIDLRFMVPPVPCQTVLESFPPSLMPAIQGFLLTGTFSTDLLLHIDYDRLSESGVSLRGKVGIRNCVVKAVTEDYHVKRFMSSFEHLVMLTPDRIVSFIIGPENEDFAPIASISPHILHAVLTTEDAGFFKHRGFIPSQFQSALSRNLIQGGFRLGASTITMQTVKNVLLSQEKTLSRKLQELFLTWYLETYLSKERIMEIYLNAIEFGPEIYGVGAASRHYFGKRPEAITPLEAAFFASLLPSPKRRYLQYCEGELSPAWDRYVRRILKRMMEKGFVSESEWNDAASQRIVFNRDFSALSREDCMKELQLFIDAVDTYAHDRLKEAVERVSPELVSDYVPPLDKDRDKLEKDKNDKRQK